MSKETQKIVKAFDNRHELIGPFDGNWQELCIAATFRELINQLSRSTPPDQNIDEFYARLYGSGDDVIYVEDLMKVIEELENE